MGFAAIALAFAAFQAVTVVVDARLQAAIEGRARSTVTSLAGLLTEVATIATFALYAAGSAVASHAVLFAALRGRVPRGRALRRARGGCGSAPRSPRGERRAARAGFPLSSLPAFSPLPPSSPPHVPPSSPVPG